MSLKDRMAVVTGAGSGIGRAIALALAARGAAVAAIDIDAATGAGDGGPHRRRRAAARGAIQCDASRAPGDRSGRDRGRPRRWARSRSWSTTPAFSTATSTSTRWTRQVWRRVIDIDLTGVFLGCKRALAEMLPRGRGRIVNMASVAGLNGTGGGAAYIAAKHGVVGLTRQMAVVYSSRGVTINCRLPGPDPDQPAPALAGDPRPRHPGHERARRRGERRADSRGLMPAGTPRLGRRHRLGRVLPRLGRGGLRHRARLVVDGGWRAK